MPFTVLGECAVRDNHGDAIALGAAETVALAVLLASPSREATIDDLAAVLDASGDDARDLEHVIDRLRRAIGSDRVVRGPPSSVRLLCHDDEVDATAFEHLVRRARTSISESDRAIDLLREAMGRWNGPAFGSLRDLDCLRPEAERLEHLRLGAEDLLVDLLLDERHDDVALQVAERLLDRDPCRENAIRLHVLSLYRCDRRAKAIRVLREATARRERNGDAPSRVLADLELAMVLQRPNLEVRRVVTDAHVRMRDDPGRRRDHSVHAVPGSVSLVGRREERRWFEDRLADASEGSPFFAIVEGETGIGKSHLVRHIAQVAARGGWEVLSARADERIDVPLWPLLPQVLPRLRDVSAEVAPDSLGAQLLTQLAELRPILDESMTSVALRHAAFRAALTSAAARSPVLVVVDDLQWCDPATMSLLLTSARLLSEHDVGTGLRLAIVATARSPAEPVADILEQIRREPQTFRIVLQGLDDLEIEELVRRFGVQQPPRDWVARLTRITGGNPLFAGTAIRNALIDGRVELDRVDASLSSEVHGTISARLAVLDNSARDVALGAAIVGDPWDVGRVAAVVGRDPSDVATDVQQLVQHAVLTPDDGGFRFAHPLFEAAVLSTADGARKREMHARTAAVLATGATDARAHALLVFRHLAASDGITDAAVAMRVAMQAGEHAETLFAWGDAADCFEHALHWLDDGQEDAVACRADLLRRAGMARLHNGEPTVAKRLLEAATDDASRSADEVALALAWIGRIQAQAVTVRPGDAIEIGALEELAEALEASRPSVAANAWANLVQAYWMSGRMELARSASQRALRLAEATGDHRASLWALWNHSMTQWARLELTDAMRSLERAARHAAELEDRKELTGPIMRLPLCHFWLGEIAESAAAIERARTLSLAVNYTLENGLFLNAQAQHALARGAFDEAEDLCSSCLIIDSTTGYPWAAPLALPTLARLRYLRDDVIGVRSVLSRWVNPGSGSVHEHIADSLLCLADGTAGPQRPIDDTFMRVGGDTAAGLRIELAFEHGDPQLCVGSIDLISELNERKQRFTTTMALSLPRLTALASSLAGRDSAVVELRAAQHAAAEAGLHLEVLLCELALAVHLKRAGDHLRARGSFAVAERLAMTIGAHQVARASRNHRRDVEDTPDRSPVATAGLAGAETVSIMFVDIAESTALTERLGDWAFRTRARRLEALMRAIVEQHRGRLAVGVTLGDGILADFPSASDAAASAIACAMVAERERLPVHVGLHSGDVLREAGTIFGGAVNIAARVCSLSEPGSVLASQTFCEVARTSTPMTFVDIGTRALKGISEPLRIFSLRERDVDVRPGPPVGMA